MKKIKGVTLLCVLLILISALCACSGDKAPFDPAEPESLSATLDETFSLTIREFTTAAFPAESVTAAGAAAAVTAGNSTTAPAPGTTVPGTAATAAAPQTTPAPAAPQTAAPPVTEQPATAAPAPAADTVTISINCATILDNMDRLREGKAPFVPADGSILPVTAMELHEGDTVYDVLSAACRKFSIQMEHTETIYGIYIEGINQLYEKDCGPLSGWMYRVNGELINASANQYTLKKGDAVEWVYTCSMGDVGFVSNSL